MNSQDLVVLVLMMVMFVGFVPILVLGAVWISSPLARVDWARWSGPVNLALTILAFAVIVAAILGTY